MCGLSGYFETGRQRIGDISLLKKMADTLIHRGPDSSGYFVEDGVGLGFRRLSLIDLEGGDQPLYNEDESIVLICNGEIFNYRELREALIRRGHAFRTNSDVEVLVHLYEEQGMEFLNRLNGQFAFALYDKNEKRLFLARDHVGICPLFYTVVDGTLIFASEIKAILACPAVHTEVDLVGLDQILTFPGLISPRTMFKGIYSLPSGHMAIAAGGDLQIWEYWDLDYPREGELNYDKPESYYLEKLYDILSRAVKLRLHADVPVGLYLSGGLDSSLVAALANGLYPETNFKSFSISFADKDICESKYQRLVAKQIGSTHYETFFDWAQISDRLKDVVYYSESALKETYNTASITLSETARENGVKAILTGEGADELFAGYVGYRFDQLRRRAAQPSDADDLEAALEDELRLKLWGDTRIFYETDFLAHGQTKKALYSSTAAAMLAEHDCLTHSLVNKDRLRDRHFIHQRSYLDFKLRLSDHLLSDHGDRMALANSIEARYPFLDLDLVEFAREIPPALKLNGFTEKYILKELAKGHVLPEITRREKYAFHAPGSPYLLGREAEWINDMLSFDLIKRQGYFNPHVIEGLKKKYSQNGFKLNLPFDSDLLIMVLTFGIFLELFKMPNLN